MGLITFLLITKLFVQNYLRAIKKIYYATVFTHESVWRIFTFMYRKDSIHVIFNLIHQPFWRCKQSDRIYKGTVISIVLKNVSFKIFTTIFHPKNVKKYDLYVTIIYFHFKHYSTIICIPLTNVKIKLLTLLWILNLRLTNIFT